MKTYTFYDLCRRVKCNGKQLNLKLKIAGILNQYSRPTEKALDRTFVIILGSETYYTSKVLNRLSSLKLM